MYLFAHFIDVYRANFFKYLRNLIVKERTYNIYEVEIGQIGKINIKIR